MNRRDFAYFVILSECTAIALATYYSRMHEWQSVIWSSCVAVAIPCWLIAVKTPTFCGVETQKGLPCENPTTGLLFGCNQARNGVHVWAKFFARFGWRRQVAPRVIELRRKSSTVSNQLAPSPAMMEAAPSAYSIVEQRRNAVAFYLAIASTIAGVVSAVSDIAGAITS